MMRKGSWTYIKMIYNETLLYKHFINEKHLSDTEEGY
jgi:hypothetical protein